MNKIIGYASALALGAASHAVLTSTPAPTPSPIEHIAEQAPYDPRPFMWKKGHDSDGHFLTNYKVDDLGVGHLTVYRRETGFQAAIYDGKMQTNLDLPVKDLWTLSTYHGIDDPTFGRPVKVGSVRSDFDDSMVDLFWHEYWVPKQMETPGLNRMMW